MKKHGHAFYVAQVEKLLRELGLPYVAVDEARKAIFASGNQGKFDLLIYMEQGQNLLATVLPKSRHIPTAEERRELAEWQTVFGKEFVGVFIHADDEPTVWRLDEQPREPKRLGAVLSVGWEQAPVETPTASAPDASDAQVEPPPAWGPQGPAAPVETQPPPSTPDPPDPIEAAIQEHRDTWSNQPQWEHLVRDDDPPLRSVFTDAQGGRHTVVWVWRTAGPHSRDAMLHLCLLGPDGHQWGESGRRAERIAADIAAGVTGEEPADLPVGPDGQLAMFALPDDPASRAEAQLSLF